MKTEKIFAERRPAFQNSMAMAKGAEAVFGTPVLIRVISRRQDLSMISKEQLARLRMAFDMLARFPNYNMQVCSPTADFCRWPATDEAVAS